jgi:excisionase family DNA binding protein
MTEAWLTVEQVAAHLNIASITVYRWIDAEKIPCHKVGRQWRFKASEVDEWIRNGDAAEESLPRKRQTLNEGKVI